nr:cbb3-type cytochrome oxidase assembly protein CcoS [Qipengyuania sphaerica]
MIPIALGLGLLGLAAFFWAMRKGQFEDLDGAAQRILIDDEEEDAP